MNTTTTATAVDWDREAREMAARFAAAERAGRARAAAERRMAREVADRMAAAERAAANK